MADRIRCNARACALDATEWHTCPAPIHHSCYWHPEPVMLVNFDRAGIARHLAYDHGWTLTAIAAYLKAAYGGSGHDNV
jgi:hypothetical protein